MYHFVQYDKKKRVITGYLRSSSDELIPKPSSPDEEYVPVTDAEQAEQLSRMNPMTSRLGGEVSGGKVKLKLESLFHGEIKLTCDLPDGDGDGLPELPADGRSVARIKATLYGDDGKVVTSGASAIRFQVSRGSVSRREVKAAKGVAEVEVRSVAETVRIRVTASAAGFKSATLEIETIPEEEYQSLAGS
jgi:hypothetical protein